MTLKIRSGNHGYTLRFFAADCVGGGEGSGTSISEALRFAAARLRP